MPNLIKFLSLASFFKDKNKAILESQASLFLKSKSYEAFLEMVSHGYVPTKKQLKLLDDETFNWATSRDWSSYIRMDKLIGKGLPITDKHILGMLSVKNGLMDSYYGNVILQKKDYVITEYYHVSGERLDNLSKEIRKRLDDPNFFNMVYKSFKFMVFKSDPDLFYNSLSPYEKLLRNCSDKIFKDIPFDEFMNLYVKIKQSRAGTTQTELLENILNTTYNKGLKDILIKTKETYADEFVQNKTLEKIQSEIATTKDLPEAASKLVRSIEDFYQKIKLNKDPSVEQSHLIDNLLEKRVPEILAKYLKVDPTYRTSMFNLEGKNAEQLMFESLENVQVIFHDMFEELNKNSLNSLTATNRYTKMLRPK
jgi:hypothetical protein